MIGTKEDLKYYLKCDRVALKVPDSKKRPRFFSDEIWKYERNLRFLEYHTNNVGFNHKVAGLFRRLIHHRSSVKYGFSIPENVFGPGLSIAHIGTIVVNRNARIGANCRIQEGVNIGATNGSADAPIIGDNCFLGSGAKVIGGISLGNNIAVGAGAVVVKSFSENSVSLGGVPAKIISHNGSGNNVVRATDIVATRTNL